MKAITMGLKVWLAVPILILSPAQVFADEPAGCDGFKWPLKHEAELMLAPHRPVVSSAAALKPDGQAVELKLVDIDAAALPTPPERGPKAKSSLAGFLRYEAPPVAGSYQITISQAAWIDVVQDGHYIKPSAFSGAVACPGVRKSIRVTLAASPFIVQISGTQAPSIFLVTETTPNP